MFFKVRLAILIIFPHSKNFSKSDQISPNFLAPKGLAILLLIEQRFSLQGGVCTYIELHRDIIDHTREWSYQNLAHCFISTQSDSQTPRSPHNSHVISAGCEDVRKVFLRENMMESCHGNAFHTIGPCWRTQMFTGHHHKGLVMWCFDNFFVVGLNKLLKKPSSCQWFEMSFHDLHPDKINSLKKNNTTSVNMPCDNRTLICLS